MRIVRTVGELREAIRELRPERGVGTVGMVPTMGALHEGHLSLVRAARSENEIVVLSIFVNPKQFNEAADLALYPRQEATDAALAERAGVDIIFAPDAATLYPEGFATTVSVSGTLVETLEGATRTGHFAGVTTVVAKLLIAASPDNAYFGRKDAQQLAVVQRMAADLELPTRIVGCPTSRDDDGLARSSRNLRLDAQARREALAIPAALEHAGARIAEGARDLNALQLELEAALTAAGLGVEYVAFVDPQTFDRKSALDGPVLCAIAARAGKVRLIDNQLLNVGD